MSYPSVMVIGGSLPRATLSVVRTLGRRGIPVFGGDSRRLAPPAFSRYTRRWFSYPSGDAAKAHDVITAHVNAWRPAVLLPVGNQGWAVILRHLCGLRRRDGGDSLPGVGPLRAAARQGHARGPGGGARGARAADLPAPDTRGSPVPAASAAVSRSAQTPAARPVWGSSAPTASTN